MRTKPLIPAHWSPIGRRAFKVSFAIAFPIVLVCLLLHSMLRHSIRAAWWVRSDMREDVEAFVEIMRS